MERARIVKSTGSWYIAETGQGQLVQCRIRGRFRQKGIRTTNPVAVGDWVKLSMAGTEALIEHIEPRTNYIMRRSVNLSHQGHIIAANLDLAVLVATLRDPVTFPAFIDRFCTAAECFHIPVALVFNKVDLLDSDGRAVLEDFRMVYERIGYRTLCCSVASGEGLAAFAKWLHGKVTLLSGHSGVGKSSLINAIDPALQIRVGEVSQAHRTGQHTTTFAEMYKLQTGGYIVDTPGIRGFGLVDIAPDELAGYFPEMRALLPHCKFYNCTHINEPGCAVKQALEQGEISQTRYCSYLSMYHNDHEETYRQ
jgi:ribosome biogenesis GTPase